MPYVHFNCDNGKENDESDENNESHRNEDGNEDDNEDDNCDDNETVSQADDKYLHNSTRAQKIMFPSRSL